MSPRICFSPRLCSAAFAVQAADKVKIGFISTLSGPNAAIGGDIRDGFNLAVKLNGGKLGGLAADVIVADDQLNPDTAKQHADRLVKRDRVDFVTGTVFSNVVLAIAPQITDSKTFFIGPNAGPAQYTGAQCNPFFFVSSWPSEAYSEAAGQYVTQRGFKNVIFLAPNYQGGKEPRTASSATTRASSPTRCTPSSASSITPPSSHRSALRSPRRSTSSSPAEWGSTSSSSSWPLGLSKDIQLVVPLWGSDQDIIRAVGDPMLGLFSLGHWTIDLDNAANRKFVAEFEKEYRRLPTGYAASGYDTALLLDAAIRKVKGNLDNKEALRAAIKSADFKSVRGDFKFNANQFPVQDYYLQVVGKSADGRIAHKTLGKILTARGDAYVQDCKMK